MKHVSAVVLAAGLGKRMRSGLAKVLHPVADRPMIWYMARVAQKVSDSHVVVVLGHQSEKVEAYLKHEAHHFANLHTVKQVQQFGTGDAVKQAKPVLCPQGHALAETCVILNGDTPLLTFETVQRLIAHHDTVRATITLLTTELTDPCGYGRVIRGANDQVTKIVEDCDATLPEKAVKEVNVGTYVVKSEFLFSALDQLKPQNAQGEYYLTDIVMMAVEQSLRVSALKTEDPRECFGINTREHLALAERLMRQRIRAKWLLAGVTMIDPNTTWIGDQVEIGQDTVLYPQVHLEGKTRIGQNVIIRAGSRLKDAEVADGAHIEDFCVLEGVIVEEGVTVGPFARLRPHTVLRKGSKVGNFVELKKVVLGEGSKANHLTYLGDADVGKKVNIGAGTITCNYDGYRKDKTIIEDGVFIGSDSQLIAPVKVGKGSVIAAGTTVTQDVPEDALAISRPEQVNRVGAAARRRALYSGQQHESMKTGHQGDTNRQAASRKTSERKK